MLSLAVWQRHFCPQKKCSIRTHKGCSRQVHMKHSLALDCKTLCACDRNCELHQDVRINFWCNCSISASIYGRSTQSDSQAKLVPNPPFYSCKSSAFVAQNPSKIQGSTDKSCDKPFSCSSSQHNIFWPTVITIHILQKVQMASKLFLM